MSVRIHNITFDCADARALASFWSTLTGWHVYYDDDPEVVVAPSYPFERHRAALHPRPRGQDRQEPASTSTVQPETATRDETVHGGRWRPGLDPRRPPP